MIRDTGFGVSGSAIEFKVRKSVARDEGESRCEGLGVRSEAKVQSPEFGAERVGVRCRDKRSKVQRKLKDRG